MLLLTLVIIQQQLVEVPYHHLITLISDLQVDPQYFFSNNFARQHGGAISSVINTRIKFNETCSVTFTSNTAMQQRGAIYSFDKGAIMFGGSCDVTYNNNTALQEGGAVYCSTIKCFI